MTNTSDAIIQRAVDAWVEPGSDCAEDVVSYRGKTMKKVVFIIILVVAAIIFAGYAMTVGTYPIGFWETYELVYDHFFGVVKDETAEYLLFEWRLPRICTGLIAGAGLAAAGAVMQSILRNPLADPYTTGISSGASFGAALAIGLGITIVDGDYSLVVGAFVFALIPTAVIILVSKMRGASPTTMIMAGIAIMYIFNAMTTMIKLWISPDALAELYAWSVGTIDGSTWPQVTLMFAVVVLGYAMLQLSSRRLNVLSTGDESSRSIGVNANRLRIFCLLVVTFLAAGIVSFTGLIGFIGLVSPHICRLVIGSDSRFLIPASAAFGAALLTIADVIGRTAFQPATVQVGVITAFIGGPMFMYLILRQRKGSA